MKKHFQFQFEYNSWANTSVIDILIKTKKHPERTVQLISHIICSQDIWLDRVIGNSEYSFSIWDQFSIYECKSLSKLSTEKWLKFIKRTSEKELRAEFEYENLEGKYFETTLERVMGHIITHSAYHRGQIIQMLREMNVNTPHIDLIYYTRNDDII